MDALPAASLDAPIPLLPLPNVVLFPRAILPLHIFEERYKAMTADALRSNKQVAMALLLPGWEKSYYGRAAIEPVVCVGTIVSHESLPDGTYNFLLQGHTRARVVRELSHDKPYRLAQLQPFPESRAMEIDLEPLRQKLRELFAGGAMAHSTIARHFRQMLDSPLPTPDITDIAAFNLLEDVALKQSLLTEQDAKIRITRAVEALQEAARRMTEHTARVSRCELN